MYVHRDTILPLLIIYSGPVVNPARGILKYEALWYSAVDTEIVYDTTEFNM